MTKIRDDYVAEALALGVDKAIINSKSNEELIKIIEDGGMPEPKKAAEPKAKRVAKDEDQGEE